MNTERWSRDLTTRNGFSFHVRSVATGDEPLLAEFFTQVTLDDLRFRFLNGVNVVSHDRLLAMINVDHRQKESFLAFAADGIKVIATAMLACDDAMTTGEVAISIRSDHKGRGVSWELLGHVAQFAEALGVQKLQSIESRANHAAIELERDMGFTARLSRRCHTAAGRTQVAVAGRSLSVDVQVSEAQLESLIPRFYARVRDDALIGPVFISAIGDWTHHLDKLVTFWSSVMLTSGRYKGNPVATHLKHLPTITPPMFDRWLTIWTEVTAEMLPPAAASALQSKAARIAESLKLALYFRVSPTSGMSPRPAHTPS